MVGRIQLPVAMLLVIELHFAFHVFAGYERNVAESDKSERTVSEANTLDLAKTHTIDDELVLQRADLASFELAVGFKRLLRHPCERIRTR